MHEHVFFGLFYKSFITFLKVPFDLDDERNHPTQSRKIENDEITMGPNKVGPAFNQDAPGSLNFLYTVQTGTGVGSDSISVDPF